MKNFLLPHGWKYAGFGLTFMGVLSFILYEWFGFKLKIPVFAFYSRYFRTKVFETIKTPFADELTLLLIITGLALIVFSRERDETEMINLIRIRSLTKAVLFNTALMLLCLLFIYGTGYIAVLVVNLFSLFVIYLIIFYLEKRKLDSDI